LWREGRAYASFKGIIERTGLSMKRVDKWLPRLCGDAQDLAPMEGPSRCCGQLLIRVALGNRDKRFAQEYVLSEAARSALMPKRDSAA
jgi:hypothetical protein